MARGIEKASSIIASARRDVPKIVVLFTSGPETSDIRELQEATRRLNDLGSMLFIIAIENQQFEQLQRILPRTTDIQHFKMFDDLTTGIVPTARRIRQSTG